MEKKTRIMWKTMNAVLILSILIYAIALLLMIKLLIGVVGLNEKSLDEGGVDKTEIRKAR